LRGCDPDQRYRLFFVGGGIHSYFCPDGVQPDGAGRRHLDVQHQPPWENLPGVKGKSVTGRWGAVVDVSEVQGKPITVRLQECGSLTVRFVDPQGRPVAGHAPGLQLVLAPGPSAQEALRLGRLARETVWLLDPARDDFATQIPPPARDPKQTDAGGRITFFGLIPGATYRLLPRGREDEAGVREFSVAAEEHRRLPDIVLQRSE
jgi:hypothetical protein